MIFSSCNKSQLFKTSFLKIHTRDINDAKVIVMIIKFVYKLKCMKSTDKKFMIVQIIYVK